MSELPRDPAGGWWTVALELQPNGQWRAQLQLADGSALILYLQADADPATVIPAAVAARIARDRRWTPKYQRGGEA